MMSILSNSLSILSSVSLQGSRPRVGDIEVGSASEGVSVKYISKARAHCADARAVSLVTENSCSLKTSCLYRI